VQINVLRFFIYFCHSMRSYLFRSNAFMQQFWSSYYWKTREKAAVHLTFDDGPHPVITPFVLDLLKKYDVRATFFCIGNNVARYPEVYQSIIDAGHTIGNHTYDHKNGWKTPDSLYIRNVLKAEALIGSRLFRPPYGRIRNKQARYLIKRGYKIVMWSLLTGDFDRNLSPESCWNHTVTRLKEGDIIVFHDSEKAWDRLEYALPRLLAYCRQKKWDIRSL